MQIQLSESKRSFQKFLLEPEIWLFEYWTIRSIENYCIVFDVFDFKLVILIKITKLRQICRKAYNFQLEILLVLF